MLGPAAAPVPAPAPGAILIEIPQHLAHVEFLIDSQFHVPARTFRLRAQFVPVLAVQQQGAIGEVALQDVAGRRGRLPVRRALRKPDPAEPGRRQAVGRHVQLQLESFYAFNEGRDDGAGARFEIQVVY